VTTGSQDVLSRLEAMLETLQHLSIEQKTVDPMREAKVDELRKETREAIQALKQLQREQQQEGRMSAFLESIDRNTATSADRLRASEERLKQLEYAVIERAGPKFERRDEIEAEGRWLKEELAGPTTDDQQPRYLKDATRPTLPSGLEVLSSAVTPAGSTAKTRQKST
jgi:hypothetical protein